MTCASSSWLQTYLQKLCEQPLFIAARSVVPLWLAREGAEPAQRTDLTPAATRVTIQMAAELSTRIALIGPAGAGKSTLLRQLAIGLAEMIRADERPGSGRGDVVPPIPLYVDLSRFSGGIEATLATTFGLDAAPLAELAHDRPFLFLLDGLDELAPSMQLAGLAAISATIGALGTQARWIATCRSENLALFRPWLGAIEVRSIRPLLPRDVIAAIQQHSPELAAWLQRAEDLATLATRPRWLAGLIDLQKAAPLQPPYSRGRLLAAWVPTVIACTLETHPRALEPEAAILALPALTSALAQRQSETVPLEEAAGALAEQAHADDPYAMLQLLVDAGILLAETERREIGFRHPALRSFAQALQLIRMRPDQWPPAIFSRTWSDTVVLSYSLCNNPEMVLRRLLDSDAVALTARCLIDAEPPDQFEQLLTRSGTVTPPLRVMLADAFAAEGLTGVALEQLERAGAEGYDEAGLFGRLGELYSSIGQWRHARVAYEQALLRESGDLRYRHRLGVICGRLGELDQAAAALQAVVEAQRQRLAEAAHELGHIYLEQGRHTQALELYEQAAVARPGEPAYRRSMAGALRRLGRVEAAEAVLRELIEEDSSDAATHAELGQVCAAAGRPHEAIRHYLKAVGLRPTESQYYACIGKLRAALGDLVGARAALQRAAELDSTDATLYFALGQTCEQIGEPDAALAAYHHAARLDSHNEVYHRQLGALLRNQGDDEGAAQALRTALELRPESAETHAELAELFWRQGRHEQAIDAYCQARIRAPECADYEHALGLIYSALGKPQAAAQHLQRAVELAPLRPDLHYDAGRAAEALEQWDSVAAAYERATALAPDQPMYARAAGALHLRMGQHGRARILLTAALRRDRRDPATLFQVGLLHAAAERLPRAISALRRAAEAGRSAEYYDQLGRMLTRARRFDEAYLAFRQALALMPDSAETLHHYSRALAALGRAEAAYAAAKQAAGLAAGDAAIQQHAGALALQIGRPHEALARLDQALAIDSGLATAHLDRAHALLELDQPQGALVAAQAALALAPDLAPAALAAGQALIRMQQAYAAREMLERAIALEAHLEPAHAARRDLLAAAGELGAALESAHRAVALAKDNADHMLRLGELLLAHGDATAARQAIERALQIDPRLTAAHARLSQIHAERAAWERARYHAEQAIALAPEHGEYQALLAEALAGAGDYAAAGAALSRAIEWAPDRADWHFALGQINRRAGDDERALGSLRRAAQLASDHAEYQHALGRCLAQLGERARAVEAIEQALRLNPNMPEWRADLAELYSARGWHGEALAEINQALDAAPEIARLWRLRAAVQLQLGRADAARADLIDALRRDPHDAPSFALLARLMGAQGRWEKALEAAQRAVALQPDDAEQRRVLADVLRSLGRRAEAAEELRVTLNDASAAAEWAALADDYEACDQAERACEAWERAVASSPEDPTLRYRYGCLLARDGNVPAALAQLRQALALRPDFAAAHAQLAEIALAIATQGPGDEQHQHNSRAVNDDSPTPTPQPQPMSLEDGVQSARRAVVLQPQQSGYWRVLGAVLRRKNADGEALEALRRAYDLAPADPLPAFAFGLAALEQGTIDDAIGAFQAAVQADPASARYHAYLGMAIRRTVVLPAEPDDHGAPPDARARLEQARTELEQATTLDSACARWHYEQGLVSQLLGWHDQAIAAFDRALDLAAGTPDQRGDQGFSEAEAHMRRGLSHYAASGPAAARADMEAASVRAPEDRTSAYLLGRIACETGDFASAQALLAEVVASDSAHPQAQFFLGRALLALGSHAEALAALERAAELRPGHAGTAALLSDAYSANGRHERALAAAAGAVRLDSGVAEHHQRLSALYATVGRLKEARASMLNALTLRPDVAAWHAQLSEICQRMRMHDAARNALARAVQLAPEVVEHRYALARLLADQGRATEATAALETALQRAPDRGAWHYELGRLYQQLGDETAAREHYTSAIQYAPDAADHWHALAQAQERQKAPDAARETLERALGRFGDQAALHTALGALFEQQQHYDTAAWHYGVAIEHTPAAAEQWWRLGRVRLATGDQSGARAALEQALKLDPKAVEAHIGLARHFLEAGDPRVSLAHSQRATELSPDDPSVQGLHGAVLARLRRFDEAYEVLARAIALAPEHGELLAQYGEMALNVGQERQAIEAFERAIKLCPNEASYYYQAGRAHRRLKHYSRAIELLRRAVRLRPSYGDAIRELSTLGPLAFVAQYIRGADDMAA